MDKLPRGMLSPNDACNNEKVVKMIGVRKMEKWYTMLEVARQLKTSKEVVKYHRKNISSENIKREDGIYWINERGTKEIKDRLQKEKYSKTFEDEVVNGLAVLKKEIEVLENLFSFRLSSLEEKIKELNNRIL